MLQNVIHIAYIQTNGGLNSRLTRYIAYIQLYTSSLWFILKVNMQHNLYTNSWRFIVRVNIKKTIGGF